MENAGDHTLSTHMAFLSAGLEFDYLAEDNLELLILLSPPSSPKYWWVTIVVSCLFYKVKLH